MINKPKQNHFEEDDKENALDKQKQYKDALKKQDGNIKTLENKVNEL